MNLQERKKYSRLVELVNRRFESRFYPKLQKAIKQDISSLIEYLKINGIDSAPKYFDDNIASKSLTEIVQDLYSNVGVYHANRVYRDLRKEEKGFGFNPDFINFVTNYFRKHLVEKITFGAVKTMRDFFLPLISKAVTDGATFEEIAQAIRDKGFEKRQAARIVRTEVNSATNVAAVAAAEKFEYKTMKEWISGHDHRVRGRNPEDHANHWGLDGVIINYEDYFIDPRNKVQLFQPGDPKARGLSRDVAATTINCRCTVALVAKRDANDRLIPKTGFIKSAEPEETKELKPDYSEIIEPIDYLKDEIRDIGRDVRGIKETDLSPVLERFEGLATKEDLDEIKLFGELISGEGERQVEVVTKVRDELERLIEEKLNGDLSRIDELIDLINSKDYKPEITLQHDSKDVKDGVESLRVELLLLINSRFDGLLKEITKKKKWKFDVVKDSDDLIISATAQQV